MTPHPENKPSGREKRSPLGLPPRVGDADLQKVARIWDHVKRSVHKAHGPLKPSYLGEMNSYTATLPYFWDTYSKDFVAYLKQELIDLAFESVLTYRGILNPLPGPIAPLYPMATTGDGNCLLHAISLALWGVEDTDLHLRKLLHMVMKGEFARNHEARWKRDRSRYDTTHIPTSGFRYNSTEWSTEWDIVVDISSPERRTDLQTGLSYACLEEFHIFIMANILRRPIIVLADNMWRNAVGSSLQPLSFSGVYLPLAWAPEDCFRYPIVLAFHQMHFTPLLCTAPIPYEKGAKQWNYVVPLENCVSSPLTIHFLTEEEEAQEETLLRKYLQVESMPELPKVRFAKLSTEKLPLEMDVFDAYMKLADVRYRLYAEEQFNPENAKVLREAGVMSACSAKQLREKMLEADARHSEKSSSDKPPVSPIPDQVFSRDALEPPATSMTYPPSTGTYLPGPTIRSRYSDAACTTTGCPIPKAEPTDQYCLRCLPQTQSSLEKTNSERCLTTQCLNSGEKDYKGYCKVCFEQSNFMSDEAPSANSHRKANIVAQAQTSSLKKLQARGPPDVDQSWQQVDDLNTTIINELAIGNKKCVQPDCEFTGHPKYEGMCSKCYKASQDETSSGIFRFDVGEEVGQNELRAAPAIGPLLTEVVPVVGKQKCLVPECQLTGRPDRGGLCSGCYMNQTEMCKHLSKDESRKSASPPLAQSPASPRHVEIQQQHLWNQAASRKCRTKGCEMFATPAQDGLCSKCFKEAKAATTGPPSPLGLPPSPKRLTKFQDQPIGAVPLLSQGPLCFTVKKNMCAIPGCIGVRIGLGGGDMCMRHHEEHYTKRASAKRTPSPLPMTAMPPARVQPSAPPPSIYSNPASIAHSLPKATKSGQLCQHPKCSEPAAPPKFVACDSCMRFVAQVNHSLAGIQRKEPVADEESSFTKYRPRGDSHAILTRPRQNSDNLVVENLRNMDISEAEPKSVKKFPVGKKLCRTQGGCPFQECGDPELEGRCARCFDRDVVAQYSQIGHSRTAPVQKTGRKARLPPSSQSDVIPTGTEASSGKLTMSPSNFMQCMTPGCTNQANPQVLEGFCNDCYPAYKRVDEPSYGTRKKSTAPKSQQQAAKQRTYKTELGAKVNLCRMPGCKNYGNDQCQGYCNGCFKETVGR